MALDHDLEPEAKLSPFGIHRPDTAETWLSFTTGHPGFPTRPGRSDGRSESGPAPLLPHWRTAFRLKVVPRPEQGLSARIAALDKLLRAGVDDGGNQIHNRPATAAEGEVNRQTLRKVKEGLASEPGGEQPRLAGYQPALLLKAGADQPQWPRWSQRARRWTAWESAPPSIVGLGYRSEN